MANEKTVGAGRTPTLLERLEALEKSLPKYDELNVQRLNAVSAQFRGALKNVVEVVNAIIALQGEGFDVRVQEQIELERDKRAKAELEKAKAMLQQLIDSRVLVASESVTEDCVMVGREIDKDGNVIGLGRAQIEFQQFNESERPKVLGLKVGDFYEFPEGKFEIQEIYRPNPDGLPTTEAPVTEAATTEAK